MRHFVSEAANSQSCFDLTKMNVKHKRRDASCLLSNTDIVFKTQLSFITELNYLAEL